MCKQSLKLVLSLESLSYFCQCFVFTCLSRLLTSAQPLHRHPSDSVQVPAVRTIGNICSSSDDLQTQVVISSGALLPLRALLTSPKEGIRKEVCWTISNIAAGPPSQIQAILDAEIIPTMISVFKNEANFKTRKEIIWALSNATSGGLQEPLQIDSLVNHRCLSVFSDMLHCRDMEVERVAGKSAPSWLLLRPVADEYP